jgi:Tfp pilus assembly protein PilF/LysM repeat protein
MIYGCATSTTTNTETQQNQYISAIKDNLANHQPDAALGLTKQLLQIDDSNPEGYELQAQAYQQLGNSDKAKQSYLNAIKYESNGVVYRTAYANFLCTDSSYNDAISEYQQAYQIQKNKPQTTDIIKSEATVASATGDCYAKQNMTDNAIESYDLAIQSKHPPSTAYLGITYAYLAQNNYPKAALYISSYPDEESADIIKLKIRTLTGLLGYDGISDANRRLLNTKISQLNQKLILAEQNANKTNTVTTITPDAETKPVTVIATKPVIIVKKPITIESAPEVTKSTAVKKPTVINKTMASTTISVPATKPVVTTNQYPDLGKRVRTASNKRHYITVIKGDTLFNISKRSNVSQEEIIRLNHLKNQFVPLGTNLYLN